MIVISELMSSSGVRFGTSGARGLVTDLSDRVSWAYTTAFLQAVAKDAPVIALGHDLRPSSPAIAKAVATAIEAAGKQVLFAGALPTPALAFHALSHGMPAIMVTGSHIPFDRNGIKFYTASGEISKDDEAAITAACVADSGNYASAELISAPGVLAGYAARYLDFFPAGFLAGKRLGLYEHSSVARDFLRELLQAFGAEVVSLGRTDAFVPIDTEAVSEADQRLAREWVAEHRLDAILSTDGDADRPLIGDEAGNWLRGDIVGLLSAQYLGARVVVTPVSSNTAIERCGAFAAVLRTRIGSPYVIAGMESALAEGQQGVVGFEANGGFLVGDRLQKSGRELAPLPTRDAVLPALCVLALAWEGNMPLSQLADKLPKRFTASDRIQNVPTTTSSQLLQRLSSSTEAIADLLGGIAGTVVQQNLTDGLRLTFENGVIVHLRPSGNAPELRCYAEADSDQQARALVAGTLARIAA